MNNNILHDWVASRKAKFSPETIEKLMKYAAFIHIENQKYNLTGLKEHRLIVNELIINSIEPLITLNVPRGTRMLDIGTGAGIPGLPLCIVFPHIVGLLIDSNNKKVSFIDKVVSDLELTNVQTITGRSEELACTEGLQESFDLVVSRAMSNVYMCIELASQYLAVDGFACLYSNQHSDKIDKKVLRHCESLGFNLAQVDDYKRLSIADSIVLFKKIDHTPERYPRRFSVIKREARIFD